MAAAAMPAPSGVPSGPPDGVVKSDPVAAPPATTSDAPRSRDGLLDSAEALEAARLYAPVRLRNNINESTANAIAAAHAAANAAPPHRSRCIRSTSAAGGATRPRRLVRGPRAHRPRACSAPTTSSPEPPTRTTSLPTVKVLTKTASSEPPRQCPGRRPGRPVVDLRRATREDILSGQCRRRHQGHGVRAADPRDARRGRGERRGDHAGAGDASARTQTQRLRARERKLGIPAPGASASGGRAAVGGGDGDGGGDGAGAPESSNLEGEDERERGRA